MPTHITDSKEKAAHFGYGLAIDTVAATTAGITTIPLETAKKRFQTGQRVCYHSAMHNYVN